MCVCVCVCVPTKQSCTVLDAALSLGIETLQNMPVSRADVVTVVEGYFGTRSTECREATLGNAIHQY